jgi:hypothetical protein
VREDHRLNRLVILSFGYLATRTLTFPILFAIEEATKMDSAEIVPVMEKIVPSWPSEMPNLRLKKYVTQDKGASPEAKLSKAKSTHNCTSVT